MIQYACYRLAGTTEQVAVFVDCGGDQQSSDKIGRRVADRATARNLASRHDVYYARIVALSAL